MITEIFHLPALTSQAGVAMVERELAALPGIQQVRANLATRRITVHYTPPATEETIAARLDEIGYPLSPADRS